MVAGGMLGTAGRFGIDLALPTATGAWPVSTMVCNLVGAALLGMLTGLLAGPVSATGEHLRLLLGVGVLGAFTTYSSLAGQSVELARDGRPGIAAAYAAVTLIGGLLAAAAGLAAGRALRAAVACSPGAGR